MLSIFNFSYYDSLDNKNLKMDQVIYEKHLTNVTDIHTYYDEELVIDNNMLDNDVKIVVDYYSGFSLINSSDPTDISISCNKASNNFNKMYKMVINDLKDDKFYDYNNLYKCNKKINLIDNTKKL
ncbi:MAG: hypothetical protein RSB72_00205 [Bacilli bacterium]